MSVRTRILEAASELLSASADAEFSTRDVCAAAGVTPPTLYHHFGDKAGLIAAVIDFGWATFLEEKRQVAVVVHEHVADDVRAGWENHLEFARQNPNFYRLMWSPTVATKGAAVGEAYRMLRDRLEIGAARGQLRVSAETASRMVMAAVTGAALSVISHLDLFDDSTFAVHLREALIASVTVMPDTAVPGVLERSAQLEPTISTVAATLASKLAVEPTGLTAPEQALMLQWLRMFADAPTADEVTAPPAVHR